MADGFSLLVEFDVDEPEFGRGFEAGRLWQILTHHDDAFDFQIHATNCEMVLRMAESLGRKVTAGSLDDMWMLLQVEARDG